MGKGRAILVVSCVVTIFLFGIMCFLMIDVNPPPLPGNQDEKKPDSLLDELIIVTLGPERTKNNTENSPFRSLKRSPLDISQRSLTQNAPGLEIDFITENNTSLLKDSIQKVVPPILPSNPVPPINKPVTPPENRAINKTEKVDDKSTTSTINDTSSLIKRSVNDFNQLGRDLNSIILKIIDDSGQFNIEIKIGLNDGFMNNNETRQGKIQSKDKSKYSIFLKTKDKTNLAKNTIISVAPNANYNLEAKNIMKNNMIQASMEDFNITTKYKITENKATVIPNYRDVFKPIAMFYNRTKFIYQSDTKSKRRDLLETPNDRNDGYKAHQYRFGTVNNTVYNSTIQSEKVNITAFNLTIQTEKGGKKNKTKDSLGKPNDASDGYQTNGNSYKTANNTDYNLSIQTEKEGKKYKKEDLLEKLKDASDECQTNVSSPKTENNTANNFTIQSEKANNTDNNLTIQTEKRDKKINKEDLLEKSNGANDVNYRYLTNLNGSNTANNTAYNLIIQTEKGAKQNEKEDLFEQPNNVNYRYLNNPNGSNADNNLTTQTEKGEKTFVKEDLLMKPNDASNQRKTNLNSVKTANNTAYNLTIQTENANHTSYNLTILTEKSKLQYYVVTNRNLNTTVDAENSTISTKALEENSRTAQVVNLTIPLPNGDSSQNDTHDFIEMKKLVLSQNKTTI